MYGEYCRRLSYILSILRIEISFGNVSVCDYDAKYFCLEFSSFSQKIGTLYKPVAFQFAVLPSAVLTSWAVMSLQSFSGEVLHPHIYIFQNCSVSLDVGVSCMFTRLRSVQSNSALFF